MKHYTSENKRAWEEAFNNRSESFDTKTIERLNTNPESLFTNDLKAILKEDAKKNKILAQFCCNNGRETMGALAFGYKQTVGFDIAENMIDFANTIAQTKSLNAKFIAQDILTLTTHKEAFDTALFTVGALCWFKDLNELFIKVAQTLKSGSKIIIEDMHPFGNMLAEKHDPLFNASYPKLPVIDYFKESPWIENNGMGYMSESPYESSTFISYSHTLSAIMNALIVQGFVIEIFIENDIDQANLFPHLNHQGLPLTYLLVARKH